MADVTLFGEQHRCVERDDVLTWIITIAGAVCRTQALRVAAAAIPPRAMQQAAQSTPSIPLPTGGASVELSSSLSRRPSELHHASERTLSVSERDDDSEESSIPGTVTKSGV